MNISDNLTIKINCKLSDVDNNSYLNTLQSTNPTDIQQETVEGFNAADTTSKLKSDLNSLENTCTEANSKSESEKNYQSQGNIQTDSKNNTESNTLQKISESSIKSTSDVINLNDNQTNNANIYSSNNTPSNSSSTKYDSVNLPIIKYQNESLINSSQIIDESIDEVDHDKMRDFLMKDLSLNISIMYNKFECEAKQKLIDLSLNETLTQNIADKQNDKLKEILGDEFDHYQEKQNEIEVNYEDYDKHMIANQLNIENIISNDELLNKAKILLNLEQEKEKLIKDNKIINMKQKQIQKISKEIDQNLLNYLKSL